MTRLTRIFRRTPRQDASTNAGEATDISVGTPSEPAEALDLDIAANDPLVAYFESTSGAVDVEALELESPALDALRAAGVKLVVPLVSQGELIGLLNLGPRLSDQEYSTDDRRLLDNLAAQAAPALRVGQLVREQEVPGPGARADLARARGRPAHPAELPSARAARPAGLAGLGPLPAGP